MQSTISDPRAYLQQRVALFAKILFVFISIITLVDMATPSPGEPLLSSTRVSGLAMVTVYGLSWLYVRGGERSEASSRAVEIGCMLASMVAYGTWPVRPPVEGLGGVMTIIVSFPMGLAVFLRAAIVPSHWALTLLIGLMWTATMSLCSYLGFEGPALVPGLPGPTVAAFHNAIAGVSFSAVSSVVSKVVHGLSQQVREAMQLGQYTLESKLGEGGMGEVYRARHAFLRRPTAVKLLPKDSVGERAIARFEREVQETSRLTHPNTVQIFDYGRTHDGVFYYAMEYLDGITLEELVELDGPQPQARVIHIVAQAADALAEAHEMKLIHRDVKPANIVLCDRGGVADTVKVLDFGLVKDVAAPEDKALSMTATITGTPLYMAPESLTDPSRVDATTDIYALGAVAYFLLTGGPVFDGKTVVEVCGHHLHTAPEPPSKRLGEPISEALEAIVLACLDKKQQARPRSAAELRRTLLSCPEASWRRQDAEAWWQDHAEPIAAMMQARAGRPPSASTLTVASAREAG